MSIQIDTALVQGYRSNIEIQFQQRGSRLKATVETESQNTEFEFYDRIGPTEAVEITSRHSDTPQIDTPHDRRRIGLRDFDWNDMIDRPDRLRLLADPTSAYVMNAVYSLGRKQDQLIIDAALGTAYTGKQGNTEVTFPAGNIIAAGTTNLTTAKLREAKEMLDINEAVMDGEEVFCIHTANQVRALLADTSLTSSDYNTVKALVQGQINTWMGFTFIRTQLLPKTSDNRTVLIYPRSGIKLAMADDITAEVTVRPDKRYNVQTYVKGSFNASRMWEEKVISILCDETKNLT